MSETRKFEAIEVAKLRAAGASAFQVGEDLLAAHFEEKNRAFFIAAASEKLMRIGNAVGLIFSSTSPIRGQLVMQRVELAIGDGVAKNYADVRCKAAESDNWKRRFEEAEAARLSAIRENERLCAQLSDSKAEILMLRNRRTAA